MIDQISLLRMSRENEILSLRYSAILILVIVSHIVGHPNQNRPSHERIILLIVQ